MERTIQLPIDDDEEEDAPRYQKGQPCPKCLHLWDVHVMIRNGFSCGFGANAHFRTDNDPNQCRCKISTGRGT